MSVTVQVEPREILLAPGSETSVVVTVANASDNVEHYKVDLRGLPAGHHFTSEPDRADLHPGRSADLTVTITADAVPPPLAGRTVVGVVAYSPYRSDVMRATELILTTPEVPELALAVRPELLTGGDTRATAEVSNSGNTPLDVELDGRDAEGKVRLTFDPGRVALAPGTSGQVELQLSARRPLNGTEVRRQVTLVARSAAGETEKPLVLVQKPLVPGGAGRLAMAAAGVGVIAAALIGSAVLAVGKLTGNDDQTAQSPAPPTPATTTGAATSAPASTAPPSDPASSAAPIDGGNLVVDLAKPPLGKPDENQNLTPDAHPGLVLSVAPDTGRPECNGVTQVSYLHFPGGRNGTVAGTFATASDGSVQGRCNDLPLRMSFQPAAVVTIEFIAGSSAGSTAPELGFRLRSQGEPAQSVRLAPGQATTMTIRDGTGDGLRDLEVSGDPAFADVSPVVTRLVITPMP